MSKKSGPIDLWPPIYFLYIYICTLYMFIIMDSLSLFNPKLAFKKVFAEFKGGSRCDKLNPGLQIRIQLLQSDAGPGVVIGSGSRFCHGWIGFDSDPVNLNPPDPHFLHNEIYIFFARKFKYYHGFFLQILDQSLWNMNPYFQIKIGPVLVKYNPVFLDKNWGQSL